MTNDTQPPAYSFESVVTLCVDFKNPHSYLAKGPSFELENEFGLQIDWQPLIVAPISPPKKQAANEDRGARHRRMRAEYYEKDLKRYAEICGLNLDDIYRNPDSTTAGVGLLWAKRFPEEVVRKYIDLVFDRYWTSTLDIEDPLTIGGVFDEIGADGERFVEYAHAEGVLEIQARQTALRGAGLFNVPGYVVEGEIFYGRQHLPMIRWLLSGRKGRGPI